MVPRLMNVLLGPMLQAAGLGDGQIDSVKAAVDGADSSTNATLHNTVQAAAQRVFGGFAVLMTSVGIPMFLRGRGIGDVHDMSYTDVNQKQEDPVQWGRSRFAANSQLKANVAGLDPFTNLSSRTPPQRGGMLLLSSEFDGNDAPRVFASLPARRRDFGPTPGQVVVVAESGPQSYSVYNVPELALEWFSVDGESAIRLLCRLGIPDSGTLSLALGPFGSCAFQTVGSSVRQSRCSVSALSLAGFTCWRERRPRGSPGRRLEVRRVAVPAGRAADAGRIAPGSAPHRTERGSGGNSGIRAAG